MTNKVKDCDVRIRYQILKYFEKKQERIPWIFFYLKEIMN